jgi:hypothetical protein
MHCFSSRVQLTLAAATVAGALLAAPPLARAGFLPLPASGAQVNDDPANAIDPSRDAGVSDVTGGALTAGKVEVPWATFEQKVRDSQQIFVRAFKNGGWVTQGSPASLNVDSTAEAEAPSIDFAGSGRTVPWVSWYEPVARLGRPTNIFASRFNAAANAWLRSGQSRGGNLPSLNIHVLRTAEHPSVAGGAAVAGADPVPWVTWEENDGVADDTTRRQIFVAKALKQATADAPCPVETKPAGGNNQNGFCWQQVGLDRLDEASPTSLDKGDPTLNIDPTRSGVEPDIAFTGPNDTVAWVVWYEEDPTQIDGLRSNDMVFAAKIVADGTADGGFRWVAVGNGSAGETNVLDTSGTNGFGSCAESRDAEDRCSLNKVSGNDAENPRVAAGTLTPGNPTVPWVVWQEDIGDGKQAIFVSRLVGGDHFALFNGGQPISNTAHDATRPDITFSGNVPYISWQESVSGVEVTFVGHFEGGASAPVFRLDTPSGIATSGFGDVANPLRAPISSGCTANPTNADGASCQGDAIGTPFLLYTAGSTGAQKLFAQAFAPTDVSTLPASGVTDTQATLNGSANPGGAAIVTHFDFGATSAYGMSTPDARLDVASVASTFDATASGLAQGSTLHFRAATKTDFVTVLGADLPSDIVNLPPDVSIDDLPDKVRVKDLGKGRLLTVQVTLSEPATVTLELLNRKGKSLRQMTVDRTSPGPFEASIPLKHTRGRLTLRVTATDAGGAITAVEQGFKAK